VVAGRVSATDADGDVLTFSGTQATAKGSVVVDSNGTFSYTPSSVARHAASAATASALDRADSFTVTVSDGHGGTSSVLVSVPVGSANQAPGTATVNVGAADGSTGAVSGSVSATDADGDALTFSGTQATAKGSVVVNSNGTFTYLPTVAARHAASALGASALVKSDDFTITMTDNHGATVTIPVTVTISPKNTAPVASTPALGSPDGSTGAIAGTVVAVDAEGDALAYSGSTTTTKGTVTVSPTGTFTYTPTESARYAAGLTSATEAEKTDSFNVTIVDGYGATLTVPVRVTISPLLARVNFNFVYGSGSDLWTADARSALQAAADILSSYITVAAPVTLTYNVVGTSTGGSQLANASASFASGRDGFYGTVVQNKILNGVDSNGASADGTITWNFGQPWSFGPTVSRTQYDATEVALHEVLHTFGFLTGVGSPSNMDKNWTLYDKFLVAADGTAVVGTDFTYKSTYAANLTGGNGGLYFSGANAVAAYGGLVPLYTPSTWSAGSSVSHLNPSNRNANLQVMNPFESPGLGDRTLSPVEIGILKDLGYTVTAGSPISAFAFVGFGILLFRRNRRR
jgi:VCBS repeat-containing protein